MKRPLMARRLDLLTHTGLWVVEKGLGPVQGESAVQEKGNEVSWRRLLLPCEWNIGYVILLQVEPVDWELVGLMDGHIV